MTLIFDARRTNPPPQLYKALMTLQVRITKTFVVHQRHCQPLHIPLLCEHHRDVDFQCNSMSLYFLTVAGAMSTGTEQFGSVGGQGQQFPA